MATFEDLPATGPTDRDAVKSELNISDTHDDVYISSIVDAVNVMVRSWPVAGISDGEPEWRADTVLGSTRLAARLYSRRNSPTGVEAFGDNGPVYVSRNDPDIAQLLQVGRYRQPLVG